VTGDQAVHRSPDGYSFAPKGEIRPGGCPIRNPAVLEVEKPPAAEVLIQTPEVCFARRSLKDLRVYDGGNPENEVVFDDIVKLADRNPIAAAKIADQDGGADFS